MSLGRGCDTVPLGEVGQEALHFRGAHPTWMALSVENDVALYPVDISLFRAVAVVAETDGFADLVEEARRWHAVIAGMPIDWLGGA